MKLPCVVSAVGFFGLVVACSGQGTLVAGHFGSADPTTEGFTLDLYGHPVLTPVLNDAGLSAWSISLPSDLDVGAYHQDLSPQQVNAAAGLSLSVTVRILQSFHPPGYGGAAAALFTGTHNFRLRFGAQSSGEPMLRVDNLEYTLSGLGSGYHTYNLRIDGSTGLGSLWIDGSERITGVTGVANISQARVSWGGGQHLNGTSDYNSNWNEVSLRLIPEPSSLALILVGVGMLFTRFLS